MGILKYKYKAHKLVNTLFYVIVFGVGFLLGFGAEKIDYSKLISQVLMIDSVKAYDMTSTSNSSDTVDEGYVINAFENLFDTFDYSEVPYITCYFTTNFPLTCIAMNENLFNSLYIYNSSTAMYGIAHNAVENATYYKMRIKSGLSYEVINSVVNTDLNALTNNVLFYIYPQGSGYTKWKSFANFNPSDIDNRMTSINSKVNLLDFSQYAIPEMIYNENLFKDNPDFKKVCVNTDTRFAITSNNITYNDDTGLKYFNGIDFIWFSYVPDGLSTYLYSSAEETKVTELTEEGPLFSGINPGKSYYLDDIEDIDNFFNTDSSKGEIYPGVTLEREGYTDKYSYFGWYFHPFVVHFDNTTEGNNFFNVFHFKNNIKFYSTLENGLDYYEELENARNDNVCFYIKNDYDVTILNKDIFDDDIGESTILGGDKFDINTSENVSSLNSKGLFSKINYFINNIRDTIGFINSYIYELYISLPNIVQLFIVAVFGLIVVRILIGMVVK